MPDSTEQNVYGQTYRDYEDRFDNGNPPTDDFGPPIETETIVPRNPAPGAPRITIEEAFYSNVQCNPPPELVLESCNQCGTHVHEVKVLFGPVVGTPPGGIQGPDVADQQHAQANNFGSHLGERFTNSRCTGTEITRTKLTWSVSGRTIVTWKTKTINHVKNGFVWLSDISQNPCDVEEKIGFFLDSTSLE